MNSKQQNEYKRLKTTAEKAKYLLQFEIEAKINIDKEKLEPVNQAFIGKWHFLLPVELMRKLLVRPELG